MGEPIEVPAVQDVFCAAVPEGHEDNPKLTEWFQAIAVEYVMGQYKHPPKVVLVDDFQWFFTDDPEQVEQFQPAHDCEDCRAGNDKAREFLRENPGRTIALANITYREVW